MCWVLYVATDVPSPEVPWDQEHPAFNVVRIPRAESPVARHFSKPHLHRIGAYTGCACGFDGSQANPNHPHELADGEESLRALGAYLTRAVAAAGAVELLTCWDGDQGNPPEHRLSLTPEQFKPDMRWLPERTFAIVE